jgi:RNA-splicing ligase RtcB
MPSLRVTVSLNTNQSLKTPLLLPADASPNPNAVQSCRSFVVKAAQSKLRLKKVQRIFVARTGDELITEEDWVRVLKNDVILLVSAGEEYVGLKKDVGFDCKYSSSEALDTFMLWMLILGIAHFNPNCPVVNLAQKAVVDTQAIGQLEQTAHTLPGLVHAVGQPDLHPGNKFPIGAVFVSEGWIHPPLIGGDIGCGMAWYRVDGLSRRQVDGDKGKKISENLRGLEGPWKSQQARELWLKKGIDSFTAGLEWDKSLGTIGAGNHFAELQVVESSQTDELKEDQVLLLVHSGSRGYGGDVLKRHTNEQKSSFQEDSPEAKAYMEEHERACGWAKANRDLIALRFLACLEPGNEDWSNDATTEACNLSGLIQNTRRKIESRKVVDIWHNNVEKILWPPSPPASKKSLVEATSSTSLEEKPAPTKQKFAYVHRKGAAPTYSPETREPLTILPLPGSRGTPTLILRPNFSEQTSWGLHNAVSLAHGAGRSMSRANALSSLGAKYKDTSKLLTPTSASQSNKSVNGEDVHGGTWGMFDQYLNHDLS